MTGPLRLATRRSRLALVQARQAAGALREALPGTEIHILPLETRGDLDKTTRIADARTVGFFVRELEAALRDGRADLAVHSLKDLPTELPPGLVLAAVLPRADRRDALLTADGAALADLEPAARVATGSFRRQCQLLALRQDLRVEPVRGNMDTRIEKVLSGGFRALVLAQAALDRLGSHEGEARPFSEGEMLPAPCQGVVGIEAKEGSERALAAARAVNHAPTWDEALAERAFLRELGSGCSLPAGASARAGAGGLGMQGFLARPDGTEVVRARGEAGRAGPGALGRSLARDVLARGGAEILRDFEKRRLP